MDDTPTFKRLCDFGNIREFLRRCAEREQRIPVVQCDSKIEDIFLWEFKKVANSDIQLTRQHRCRTRSGNFRL